MKHIAILLTITTLWCRAEESKIDEGHSMHGEVFNVGPRQAAVLIEGTGNVDFPVSTKSEQAQAFFNQGIGQLHGYWDFEAERSFRQAAAFDPDCAMTYWGMAMANYKNAKRAKGFLEEADKRIEHATDKEKQWIQSLVEYFDESTGNTKARRKNIAESIQKTVNDHPNDIEAKAFLYRWRYQNSRKGIPIKNYESMTTISDKIFAANPAHPAHHYVIHLWDRKKPINGLDSALQCGPAAPAVAHMWHMPGHIYSKLRRYQQATWYQEASARVDHAHMMKYYLLPDQIHNFSHNNEWLVRNLNYLGRYRDAIDLAKNMTELPRVPKFSTPNDDTSYNPSKSSWQRGRRHLRNTLVKFEQWQELLSLKNSPHLAADNKTLYQSDLDKYYAIAHYETGNVEAGDQTLAKLKTDSKEHNEVSVYQALHTSPPNLEKAKSLLPKLRSVAKVRQAQLWFRAGNLEKAVSMATEAAKSAPNQVLPLAAKIEILHKAGKTDETKAAFESLRTIGNQADLNLPQLRRLQPIAEKLKLPIDWRKPSTPEFTPPTSPELDSLGPFRWSPPSAPDFVLSDSTGKEFHLCQRKGKATLVIFYLGKGCPHCMEQLNEFAPAMQKFKSAGIDIIAISSDTPEGLQETFAISKETNGDKQQFPFPLLSDANLTTFKAYRAYDDFEKQPLHGTFLIDQNLTIRWQDIGFEPFMYSDWLLEECKRLLALCKY